MENPVEKDSICWLGLFWSMAAGLSCSWTGASCLGPAKDQHMIDLNQFTSHDQLRTSLNQLKPAAMLQNIANQHMLFFSTGKEHQKTLLKVVTCYCYLKSVVLNLFFHRAALWSKCKSHGPHASHLHITSSIQTNQIYNIIYSLNISKRLHLLK